MYLQYLQRQGLLNWNVMSADIPRETAIIMSDEKNKPIRIHCAANFRHIGRELGCGAAHEEIEGESKPRA